MSRFRVVSKNQPQGNLFKKRPAIQSAGRFFFACGKQSPGRHMISIGLTNPKSVSNVGAVMRAVGCFGADQVFYSGVRYDRAREFDTDTGQVTARVPLCHSGDLVAEVAKQQSLICVEFALGAQSLTTFEHPQNAFYLFGPEDASLQQQVIDAADHVVFVPTEGCLNLAASVNIVLYDRMAKSKAHISAVHNDALIKRSRDNRNRLKCR